MGRSLLRALRRSFGFVLVSLLLTGAVGGFVGDAAQCCGDDLLPSLASPSPALVDGWKATLVRYGWNPAPADAVVVHNGPYFALKSEENPAELEKDLALLGRLGADRYRFAQMKLLERPQLATLVASSLEVAADGPDLILQSFDRFRDTNLLHSLFGLSADPADAVPLARMLVSDGDIIERLHQRDNSLAVGWFADMPADPQAREAYRRWLRELFEAALRSSDEAAIDRVQTLLAIHSEQVKEKLHDASFRDRFQRTLWPAFREVLQEQERKRDDGVSWGLYACEPRVWDFLAAHPENGKAVFATHGPLAVDLLLAPQYAGCRGGVLDALRNCDQDVLDALYNDNLRREPRFARLMARNLPGGTLAKALRVLQSDSANAPATLRYYESLDNDALIEELAPMPDGPQTWVPGYSIYYLGKKYAQGRDVGGMDVVMAGVDAVELVFMAKGATKGIKFVQQGVAKRLRSQGMSAAADQAERATARELFPWTLQQGFREMRLSMGRHVAQAMTLDVTAATRFAFQHWGMGRATFKRLSGLEARVFMRADRRVAFDLTQLVDQGHVAGRFLRATAVNAGFSEVLQTEPAQAALRSGVQAIAKGTRQSAEETLAWKQHLSAWWSIQGSDVLRVE